MKKNEMKFFSSVCLLVFLLPLGCVGSDRIDAWAFPENPVYGYVEAAKVDGDLESVFHIVRFRSSSRLNDYVILDSVSAFSAPQMCDSNAVSFLAPYSRDSALLMTVCLSPAVRRDTVLVYCQEDLADRTGYTIPDGRVYNLSSYVFLGRDSLLFWMPPCWRRSILEIGRVEPDNDYQYIDMVVEAELPRIASDFSQVLITYIHPLPLLDPEYDVVTLVHIFDLETEAWMSPRRIVGGCSVPRRRTSDGPLYCLLEGDTHPYYNGNALCIVEDSVPRPLIEFEWPVRITQYYLYSDSIVVETRAKCGRPDYGVRMFTVHE